MNGNNCFFCNTSQKELVDKGVLYCIDCYNEELNKLLEYQKSRTTFYPEINQVYENIYIGNYDMARDKQKLNELGITHILCCGSYLEKFHPNDFVYKQLELDDSLEQDILYCIEEAIEFINSGFKTFIHCHEGISRSASILIAFIMWKEKLKLEDAKSFLKEKRPKINPNSNFLEQLAKFQKSLNY